MSGNDISGGYSGEAVVMKISNTKYLFALMNIGSTEEYHRTLLTFGIKIPNSREAALVEISKLRGSKVIPWGLYPILVTFTDIKKPESIKQVMPNDLARHFGTGYTLTAITLAITDQNMTEGYVEAVLPWIKTLKGSIGKDMALPQKHFLNKIYSGSFWQRTK